MACTAPARLPGTPSAPSSKALKVFFKYIKDSNDEPGSFDICLKANVLPVDIPDNQLGITWALWEGTSGSYNKTSGREVEFQNPTKGGLYKFLINMSMNNQLPYGTMAGSAWVLLPKAGGEIKEWMVSEVPTLVARALDWESDVRAVAVARGLDSDDFLNTAWISIAGNDFDYQGIVGNPTRRYSFTDDDRPVGHLPDESIAGMKGEKGNGDWDEPSYATLAGIVVHRAKINNAMYAVWGRTLGYNNSQLKWGAFGNAIDRGLLDNNSSQNSIDLGCELYDAHSSGGSLLALLTKEKARSLQTTDTESGLNDVNLWPDTTPVSHGFELPEMPREYDRLIQGPNNKLLGRLFKWFL